MSSGIAYPPPTYIPPLPIFNPLFFPQSFDTTTTSGGGGGFTNIFPNGLTSGNIITMDGGTGGGGGTGAERTITGLSQIEWVDIISTNPTTITGYMKLDSGVLEIGSGTASSGINVNLLGSSILANGVAIGTGTGNVSTTANNTFLAPATTQTFNNQNIIISNGGTIEIGGFAGGNPTPSYIYFPTTFPTGSTGNNGLAYFWNNSDGGGEVSMICYAQGAGGGTTSAGGLQIYSVNSSPNAPQLLASFLYGGISFNQDITSNNTFTGTNTFQSTFTVDNTLTNIGQYTGNKTGIGLNVFTSSPTGVDNVAIGTNVLSALTTGDNNTFVGSLSGVNLTTGPNNTGIGCEALISLTTGYQNTAVGLGSLSSITTDIDNTGIGYEAGYNLVGTGSNSSGNTFLGYRAGYNQTTGNYNVALGYETGVDSSTPILNSTIAIGKQITTLATGDMILGFGVNYNGTNFPYYAKFTPNTSGSGVILQGTYNNSSNITIAGNIIQIKSPTGSTNAGQLQILGGTNGGGSLQIQNSATNPPTTAGFGSFASVNGDPFYYSPSSSTWNELTTQSIGNKIVSLPSNNGIAGGLGTQWQITPLILQPISTNPTPPYGTTFNYTLYTNLTPTPQTINSSLTQLNIQGLYTSITGTGVAQQYTYTPNGTTYWGYVLSSTINCIGALTDLQFQQNLVGTNNNFYFTCSSTDASLLSTTVQLIIRPNP